MNPIHEADYSDVLKRPCFFVLKIERRENIEGVFGKSVVSVLHRDITEALRKITAQLLSRCDIGSDMQSPFFGFWFLPFSFRPSDLPVDVEERMESIRAAGDEMIHNMLKREMGLATGCKISFSLAVIPAPSETLDAHATARYLDESLQTRGAAVLSSKIGRDAFEEIIKTGQIETFLQPIISFPEEKIVGYEALSRGPGNSQVHAADEFFGAAARLNLREEAELACFARALSVVPKLPDPLWVSLNLAPHLMESDKFWGLVNQIPKNLLHSIVLEMTEHLPISTADRLQKSVQNLKNMGIRLALDDTGCGFADMDTVRIFRPEIVKLCITVTRRIGQHPQIEKDIRETVKRVSGLGGKVLGEGVEQKEQGEILKECGVSLAQGFYYARPAPAEEAFKSFLNEKIAIFNQSIISGNLKE